MRSVLPGKSIARPAVGSLSRKWLGILVAVAFAAVGLRPVAAQKEVPDLHLNFDKWFLQRLGTGDSGTDSEARDIAADGEVAGITQDAWLQIHAFRFHGSTLSDVGGAGSWGEAINDSGQVAGGAIVYTPEWEMHAFRWYGTTKLDLGHLSGGRDSHAYGINNLGDVVGRAQISGLRVRAFLWKPSTGMVGLGTLGGTDSFGSGINDSGEVVGAAEFSGTDDVHAFRYSDGVMSDAGTLGGVRSSAFRINNAGQMVGWAHLPNGVAHACLWNSGAGAIDLDRRTGSLKSEARDINNSGVIVGTAEIGLNRSAVRWTYNSATGQYDMLDLNSLIPASAGIGLVDATGINDTGQIVGWGVTLGGKEAFLLTPVRVKSLQFSANPVIGGNGALGLVEFTNLFPVDTSVGLSNTNPAVTVPASFMVDAGHGVGGFVASTLPVTSTTSGTIKASLGLLNSVSTPLTVRPPGVKTIVLSPTSVHAGTNSVATITLEKPAGPGGIVVTVTSSSPGTAWPAQSSKTIGQGSTTAVMTIHTASDDLGASARLIPNNPPDDDESTLNATIKATANGITRAAVLKVVF